MSTAISSFVAALVLGLLPGQEPQTEGNCPAAAQGQSVVGVTVTGLTYTEEHVVRRELLQGIGEPFSCERWSVDHRRLHNLDIFADATLSTRVVPGGVELTYDFRELPILVPYPSIKRTDQDGWLLGAGGTTVNFLGRAIRIDLAARAGVDPLLDTKEMVLFTSSRWLAGLSVGHELWFQIIHTYNELKGFDERATFGTLELYPRIVGRIEAIAAAGALHIAHTRGAKHPFLADGGADVVPRLGLGIRRDGHDDRADPRSGTYAEARITQHGRPLGGPADFTEYLLDLRGATSPSSHHVLLATSLFRQRTGTVPFYESLHVGGPNTLRAYQPSPSRSGSSEFLASAEYRMVVADRTAFSILGLDAYAGLQATLGADVAVLWDDAPFRGARSFGALFAGLHVLVPGVQRLRIELGVRDDLRTFGLTVGVYERATIQRWRVR